MRDAFSTLSLLKDCFVLPKGINCATVLCISTGRGVCCFIGHVPLGGDRPTGCGGRSTSGASPAPTILSIFIGQIVVGTAFSSPPSGEFRSRVTRTAEGRPYQYCIIVSPDPGDSGL